MSTEDLAVLSNQQAENDELHGSAGWGWGVELAKRETTGIVTLGQKEANGIYVLFQGQADA